MFQIMISENSTDSINNPFFMLFLNRELQVFLRLPVVIKS